MLFKIAVYLICTLIIFLSYKKNPQKFKAIWSSGLERRKTSKTYRNFAFNLLIFVLLCIAGKQLYISYGATKYLAILSLIINLYLVSLFIYSIHIVRKAIKQKDLKPSTGEQINYRLYDFVYIFVFLLQYYLIYTR